MNSSRVCKGAEPLSAEFWASAWQELQREARFKTSQDKHPQRWRQFYDHMAPIWEAVTGGGTPAAQAVTKALDGQGLLPPESSVLEVGCGPGSLALALSDHVNKVTAVDDSAGMLEVLRKRAAATQKRNIATMETGWQALDPNQAHDLAMAAFFPAAMTPTGLECLERHARKACALVVGTGSEVFPLRRAIWEEIMDRPLPSAGFQLPCAVGYLLASSRRPDLKHISWQARLDLPIEQVARFFESYFAIFDKKGPEVNEDIARMLKAHATDGKLRMTGQGSAALLTWPVDGHDQ